MLNLPFINLFLKKTPEIQAIKLIRDCFGFASDYIQVFFFQNDIILKCI